MAETHFPTISMFSWARLDGAYLIRRISKTSQIWEKWALYQLEMLREMGYNLPANECQSGNVALDGNGRGLVFSRCVSCTTLTAYRRVPNPSTAVKVHRYRRIRSRPKVCTPPAVGEKLR
ncbi:hypothetical protein RF11_13586 [Thelohanellus kitauei]|uniref:Uncharacterized protein n=1 Tax=Thelohanellus kitauei TaxID=669202 RepID=A0A0C2NG94_THEKT|nr:hypothetical protein RF11_13586 [Thelohanellus kitauei]